MIRKAFLLSALVLSPIFAFPTCIVIIKTATEIIVGADSRQTVTFLDNRTGEFKEITNDSQCKIHKTGNFYYAISGFDDGALFANAQQVCSKSKTINETIALFSNIMKKYYETNLENMRKANIKKYKERFVGNDVSAVSFFCVENKQLELRTVYFKAINNPLQKVNIEPVKTINSQFNCLGARDHIDKVPELEAKRLFEKKTTFML